MKYNTIAMSSFPVHSIAKVILFIAEVLFLNCEQAPVQNHEVQCCESHPSWIHWWQRREGLHHGL